MVLSWEEKVVGHACPFDYPRPAHDDSLYFVRKLSVSSLYLLRNQTYRGHSVLIYDLAHVLRIDQLSAAQWNAQANDIHRAEVAVFAAVQPDHVNIASLGNVMPHLHWHIVPRYKSDPRWGDPIWTTDMPVGRMTEDEYRQLAANIDDAIEVQ